MNLGTSILLIVVAAIAGYVFGLIDKRFTDSIRKKREKPTEAEEISAAPKAGIQEEIPPLKITQGPNKQIKIEMDGTPLSSPETISPEQRQRLINLLVSVRPWVEFKQAIKPSPPSPATNPPPSIPKQPAQPTTVLSTPTPDTQAVSLIKGINSMVTRDVRTASEKNPPSIVGMIDEVLQTRLLNSPHKDRGIRLEDGPMGGVMVWVGNQRYEGIDAVPDQDIQAMIKSAVAEWEKS